MTVSCFRVRICVARIVTWMTVPSTSTPLPTNRTQSPTPYCFSVRTKKPARKSAMMDCAPKPIAAETTVAGIAAPANEKPISCRNQMDSRKYATIWAT